jgi:hypothetical protein
MEDGKPSGANSHFEESVLLPDSSESSELAHYPLLDMESDDESHESPELNPPELNPVTSVPASPYNMNKYPSPSPPSNVNTVSGSTSFLSTMEGWLHAIPDVLSGTILKETANPELAAIIKQKAEEMLSQPDEAQKNIFDQIEGILNPELKQAVRYSYEIYSCVQALCCMAHDKIAMAFIQMLKKILSHYVDFVKGLEGGSQEKRFHSGKMLQTLVRKLQESFNGSFPEKGFKTVGQETCRAAGELIIEIYCEWLKRYGIVVEPPVIACMISRAAAKRVLEECKEQKREKSVPDDRTPEQIFYRVIMDSDCILPDSVPVMDKKRLGGSDGLSRIDASPLPNNDAVFLCFQGQEAIFPSTPPLASHKSDSSSKTSRKTKQDLQPKGLSFKRQSLETELVPLSDETPELLAKFNVFDSSKDDWVLHLGANRDNKSIPIPHLSCGIAFLTCVPFFDIDRVDSKFFNIFKKNHNNPFFKPLQLTYMPTALFESMVKNPKRRTMLIEDFEKQLNPFLSRFASTAKKQAHMLGLEYVTPTVYKRVTKDGILQTLVGVTAGTFSNDTSSAIISRVNPEIFNSAARGRTSAAGCIKQAACDFCYMGQDMTDDELQREADSAGLIVVVTSAVNKEFGDLAKALELLKARAVIPASTPFVTLYATGDHMAGTAACLPGLRVCTYGATVIVRTSVDAVNEKLTMEIRKTIAELQAKMIILSGDTLGENHLYKKLQLWFKDYRSKIKSATDGAVKQLMGGRQDLAVELLPALLTYMYKLEKFDHDNYLVAQSRFDEIVKTKLNHKTHLGTQSELDFLSLVVNQEKLREVMDFDGLLAMASEKLEYVTPSGIRMSKDELMPLVKNEIEKMCNCNDSFTSYIDRVYSIDEKGATEYVIDRLKEIFVKLPLFSLLQRYNSFISNQEIRVNFKDADITVSMCYIKPALDEVVIKLLKADILKNTTRRKYRTQCVFHAKSIFKNLQIEDALTQDEIEFLQAYDSVGRGEAHAENLTQESVLDQGCHVEGIIDTTGVAVKRFKSQKGEWVDEEALAHFKEIRRREEAREAAAREAAAREAEAAAAREAAAVVAAANKLLQSKKLAQQDLIRAQKQETKYYKGRRGGTRKKSKIQKRKITRRYKGKNSRHNHTIKNRNIRNYSLRNKQ